MLNLVACKSQQRCDSFDLGAFTHYQINQYNLNAGDDTFVFNVYDKPYGKVIFNLPSDEEAGWGVLIEDIEGEYFKLTNIWSQEYVKSKGGHWANYWKKDWMPAYKYVWIEKGTVGINSRNHDGQTVNLYNEPESSSKIIGQFTNIQTLVVWDACENWAYVEVKDENGKKLKGWLSPEDQCANPYTTCN